MKATISCKLSIVIILFFIGTFLNNVGIAWEHNPSGAVNAAIFATSADEQRMVIGTPESGCFITHDGGNSWELFNPWHPYSINEYFRATALDDNADTLLISVQANERLEAKFAYSFNGGQDWDLFIANMYVETDERFVVCDNMDHDRFIYYNTRYVAISNDACDTWNYIDIDSRIYTVGTFFQDPLNDSTFFAAGTYGCDHGQTTFDRFIRRSDDRGLTWYSVTPFDSTELADIVFTAFAHDMIRLTNGDLIVGYSADINYGTPDLINSLLLSEDDGATWETYNGGLPSGFYSSILVEDPDHPGVVFTSGPTIYGVYRSDDYGRTFERCTNGLPTGPTKGVRITSNEYNGNVYVGFAGWGVYRTSDGGQSWESLPMPPIGSRVRFNVFENSIVLRHPGYVFKRYDFGNESWSTIQFPEFPDIIPMTFPIRFVDGDIMVTGSMQYMPDEPNLRQVATLRSDDAGEHWSQVGEMFDTNVPHYSVHQGEDETIFYSFKYLDGDCRAIVSTDTGATWDYRATIPGFNHIASFPIPLQDETYLYANCKVSLDPEPILRSSDQGHTFHDMDFPDNANVMHLLGDGRLMVDVYINNPTRRLYYYDGNEWFLQNNSIHYTTNIINIPGNTERLVTANSIGDQQLMISEDTGVTWQEIDLDIPYEDYSPFLGSLEYDPYREWLWLCTGIGLCYINIEDLSVESESITPIPFQQDLISCFPNPFNLTTTVNILLSRAGHVEIDVYTIEGRFLTRLNDRFLPAGKHQIPLNMDQYSSGTYIISMDTDRGRKSRRITLVK